MELVLNPNNTNLLSDAYLKVNHAGIGNGPWGKMGYTILRTDGRVDWQIVLVAKGMLIAEYKGEERELNEGDFVVYKPHERQRYTFPAGSETKTFYVHFTGTAASEIVAGLSLTGGFYSAPPSPTLVREFDRLCTCGCETPADAAEQNSVLLSVLSMLSKAIVKDADALFRAVRPALEKMRSELSADVAIEEYAALCGMSAGRFQHQFREAMGVPPHRYLTDLRVADAKELLAHSDLSVSEVSALGGIRDPLYLSRVFRRRTGVTPTDFRKERKGGADEAAPQDT